MHPSIPKPAGVEAALKKVMKRLKAAQKRVNTIAARDMKSGRYELAQKWMEVGRTVADFADRAEAFADEWKRVVKATKIAAQANGTTGIAATSHVAKPENTPVWRFCSPALKVLVQLGGTARFDEVVAALDAELADKLTESDRELLKRRGVPRWHVAVQRAYRQCQKEGWIEKRKRRDAVWAITAKGKQVAADASGTQI